MWQTEREVMEQIKAKQSQDKEAFCQTIWQEAIMFCQFQKSSLGG